jgi:hypothetical protein
MRVRQFTPLFWPERHRTRALDARHGRVVSFHEQVMLFRFTSLSDTFSGTLCCRIWLYGIKAARKRAAAAGRPAAGVQVVIWTTAQLRAVPLSCPTRARRRGEQRGITAKIGQNFTQCL